MGEAEVGTCGVRVRDVDFCLEGGSFLVPFDASGAGLVWDEGIADFGFRLRREGVRDRCQRFEKNV